MTAEAAKEFGIVDEVLIEAARTGSRLTALARPDAGRLAGCGLRPFRASGRSILIGARRVFALRIRTELQRVWRFRVRCAGYASLRPAPLA